MQVSGTGRILIVDDDPMVRKVVITILQKYGYSVFDAPSGQHGLKCVVEHPEIDLVLSDIVMPELSGPEMVNRILEMRPAMKVIFMTGYGDDNPPTHQVKRFGVLEKPFTIPGLLGAVRNGLEKHDHEKNTDGTILNAGHPVNDRKTALVVDDEAEDLEALRGPLVADGFCVLTATDGKSAIDLFASYSGAINVLVSDVAMYPMSGTELALHLLDKEPSLAVVFVSGHVGAQALRHDILSVTTIAFLRKPITPGELVAKVRAVLKVSAPGLPLEISMSAP